MTKLCKTLTLLVQIFLVIPPVHVYLFATPIIAFVALVTHSLSVYFARKEKFDFIGNVLGGIGSVLLLYFLVIQMDTNAADAMILTDQVTFYTLLFPVNLVSLILIFRERNKMKHQNDLD